MGSRYMLQFLARQKPLHCCSSSIYAALCRIQPSKQCSAVQNATACCRKRCGGWLHLPMQALMCCSSTPWRAAMRCAPSALLAGALHPYQRCTAMHAETSHWPACVYSSSLAELDIGHQTSCLNSICREVSIKNAYICHKPFTACRPRQRR